MSDVGWDLRRTDTRIARQNGRSRALGATQRLAPQLSAHIPPNRSPRETSAHHGYFAASDLQLLLSSIFQATATAHTLSTTASTNIADRNPALLPQTSSRAVS